MALMKKKISNPIVAVAVLTLISIFTSNNLAFGATTRCVREDFESAAAYLACTQFEAAEQEVEEREAATTTASGGCRPGSGSLASQVFVPWYKYLPGETVDGKCSPVFPKTSKTNYDLGKGIPLILMAIIELLLRISGLIAVGFIIFGSIQYITSQGSPDSLKGAKSTITNAIVGLVIAMVATGFIQFLGGVFQ